MTDAAALPAVPAAAASDAVSIVRLSATAAPDRPLYEAWDDFRRDVFAEELGWPLPPRAAGGLGDRFDEHAACFAAIRQGALIGGVRGLQVTRGFPHRERFEAHLAATGLTTRLDVVGTINALAVAAPLRRLAVTTSGGREERLSSLLLEACLAWMQAQRIRVVLATVLSAVSMRVFARAGFSLLSAPRSDGSRFGFRLGDIGLVLPPPNPPTDAAARFYDSVRAHFATCERQLCAGGDPAQLFIE